MSLVTQPLWVRRNYYLILQLGKLSGIAGNNFPSVAEIICDPVRVQNWIFWLQTQYFLHCVELPYSIHAQYTKASLDKNVILLEGYDLGVKIQHCRNVIMEQSTYLNRVRIWSTWFSLNCVSKLPGRLINTQIAQRC